MTQDYDRDEFTRGFLKALVAKKPLHEWREAFIVSDYLTKEEGIVIAAIGRGAIWHGTPTPFDQLTALSIRKELQETIDAARVLQGHNINDKSC